MLKTLQEIIKLLKAGIDSKIIEKVYLINSNFKILRIPLLFELLDISQERVKLLKAGSYGKTR